MKMNQNSIREEYDPNKFFVVCMATRPGVQLYCTTLEYTYYPPRTPANDLFGLNIVQWNDLTFYVLSVPLADRNRCELVAKNLGMRLADGVPTIFDHKGKHNFPLQGSNVWSLEGNYKGDEIAEVQKIFDGDKGQMHKDFQSSTEIFKGTPADVDQFLEESVGYNSFSPIMAILFGLDRRRCVDEAFLGYIQSKSFCCCTISHKGQNQTGQPAIIGLYVIPKARKLGIGTRLFRAALQHCIDKKLTPVRVDVMSDAVMRMIEKLPPEMEQHVQANLVPGFDLTKLEEPYVLNKDWYVSK